ncbi:MAG: DNA methylase [Terrimicrobiaceae bacterium]
MGFREFGKPTQVLATADGVPVYVNEFWTSRQRAAHSLHEISYRACFKPQLPRFFIERLTQKGDCVMDPFMGRGTTLLEAALLGRVPVGSDINPLSLMMAEPRLNPPDFSAVVERLQEIPLDADGEAPEDLLVFYHEETLKEIAALREYFLKRVSDGQLDRVDAWIRMVALNRLTGHSPGFFSVYTLPPNQATSVVAQLKINEKRGQLPPRRDVRAILLKKSRHLMSELTSMERENLSRVAGDARCLVAPASDLSGFSDGSAKLVVTSPPFLDVVNYAKDNWLRCWFAGIDVERIAFTVPRKLEAWISSMIEALREMNRVLAADGWVAFEVGEVRKGKVLLEESVIEAGKRAGLQPELVLINSQIFTKTANCWGVGNNALGTNTNRIVLFRKAPPAGGGLRAASRVG